MWYLIYVVWGVMWCGVGCDVVWCGVWNYAMACQMWQAEFPREAGRRTPMAPWQCLGDARRMTQGCKVQGARRARCKAQGVQGA